MKTKNILFAIFTLLTVVMYAQTEQSAKFETKTGVTELKFEFEDMDELKNFDWVGIHELFESNQGNEIVTLGFAYHPTNNPELDSVPVRSNKFDFTISGNNSDIDGLLKKARKILESITEIYEK